MLSQTGVILSAIWSEVLQTDAVLPESDFFSLGGDSVLVMTMLLRVEEELGIFLDPGVMFTAPTLAEFSDEVDKARGNAEQSASVG